MKKVLCIALLGYALNAFAAVEDDCWKLIKPYALGVAVKDVKVVHTGSKHRKYDSINFTLVRSVRVWKSPDWDAMPTSVLSCRSENGTLSHEYGTLEEMKANQQRVQQAQRKQQEETLKRFR